MSPETNRKLASTSATKHLLGAFFVSTVVLLASGSLGSLLVDITLGGLHTSNNLARVAMDGAFATLVFAYPAPFILSALSTLYTFKIEVLADA